MIRAALEAELLINTESPQPFMIRYFIALSFVLIFFSCKKEDENNQPISVEYDLEGVAQKGPFLTGTDITIIELGNTLAPTGRVFFSTVENHTGFFAFPNVLFESNYVQVKAQGSYFNEVLGGIPGGSGITLNSIEDISSNSQINVNTITHLVHARTLVLVGEGISFSQAKSQALQELLAVFLIDGSGTALPGQMDLSNPGLDGGILLLISAIIQSNIGSGLVFQEYMTALTNDFRDNGLIDQQNLQRCIGSSARVLNLSNVRQNLINRYASLGVNVEPFAAIDLLDNFNMQNTFPTIFDGLFPDQIDGATNIINQWPVLDVESGQEFVIAINGLSNAGISNIQVALSPASESFVASNVEWFQQADTLRYILDFDGSNVTIPIEFTGSGSIDVRLYIVVQSVGMVVYPKTTVNW